MYAPTLQNGGIYFIDAADTRVAAISGVDDGCIVPAPFYPVQNAFCVDFC